MKTSMELNAEIKRVFTKAKVEGISVTVTAGRHKPRRNVRIAMDADKTKDKWLERGVALIEDTLSNSRFGFSMTEADVEKVLFVDGTAQIVYTTSVLIDRNPNDV